MSVVEDQFQQLKQYYDTARLVPRPDGTFVVEIPNLPLPTGWSKRATTAKFLVPVGFPHAMPDCFWSDPDLRLANNADPQATNLQVLPGTSEQHRWFSWHPNRWTPNRDSLLTYIKVIEARLREPR